MGKRKTLSRILSVAGVFMLFGTGCSSDSPGDFERENRDVREIGKSDDNPSGNSGNGRIENDMLVKGADVSWLTEMEALGYKFYFRDGAEGDCLEILKSMGVNTIRLRVWVDPENGYCAMDDVLVKARRAHALGMDLMIDFHYSDTWADPGAQTIPAAWKDYDLERMCQAVSEFTSGSLLRLKDEDIDVKYVQIGNETGNGMLWPVGQADKNPQGYARLTESGVDAVRSVFPGAKTIVHLQSGENASLAQWLLGILDRYHVSYDIAGFSLYPERTDYEEFVAKARGNMESVIRKFDKDVMLCEVGMPYQFQNQCYEFLNLCFDLSKQIENGRFKGLLYWEPQCYRNFNGYNKGAFLTNGEPSKAMEAFSYTDTGIRPVYAD